MANKTQNTSTQANTAAGQNAAATQTVQNAQHALSLLDAADKKRKEATVAAQAAAKASPKPKSEKRPCTHSGCKLFAMEGRDTCTNHRPAVDRLSESERITLSQYIELIGSKERLTLFVSALGPVRATDLAKAIKTTTGASD